MIYYFLSAILYFAIHDIFNEYLFPIREDILLDHIDIIKSLNHFKFCLYASFLFFILLKYRSYKLFENIYIAIIYLKYTSTFYLKTNLYQREEYTRRVLMWLFTTPAMLSMLAKINKLNFIDIKPQFHIIPTILHLFTIPWIDHPYYLYFYLFSYISQSYFIYHLYKLSHYKYTRIYISIWLMFGFINSLLICNLISHEVSTLYYIMADLIAKFMSMSLIYDLEEQRIEIGNKMDLQSFHLISTLLSIIYKYKDENDITQQCNHTIHYISDSIKSILPHNNNEYTIAKIELLKKILPYDLDDKYLLTNINRYQQHNDICILFTDIVNYADISNQLSEKILYDLLNDIYTKFDHALRKYRSLQKIETIGDSYMVVGDLSKHSSKENYIQDMISLADDLIHISNSILLKNSEKINIRIGIHIGSVAIGILGVDIPRLCVIGNSVNFASRLESTSHPNKIHISHEVYEILKRSFEDPLFSKRGSCEFTFEKRENTTLKNIGTFDTYFVEKVKKSI